MPSRLRPTSSYAPDAVLVGDPGRALLLAQELLEQPKMSNHARGLWGYWGRTPGGVELTIQSTGIGGPSAALVLTDLATLGVRRAIRVGSCSLRGADGSPGELILVERAIASSGSAAVFGLDPGEAALPDAELSAGLRGALGLAGRPATVGSFDSPPAADRQLGDEIAAADMQTVVVLARARELGIAAAAVLVAVEAEGSAPISDADRETAERQAGRAAADVLSTSS
jgi:uridine phosphorylase